MVSLQALPQSVFPDEYATLSNSRRPTMGGSGPGLAGANIWKKLGFVVSAGYDFVARSPLVWRPLWCPERPV